MILLSHRAHTVFVPAVQHSADRVYGAGGRPATWLIAAAGGVWPVCPIMLYCAGKRKGGLRRVWRQELEALGRYPRGSGGRHDGGADRGCERGRGMGCERGRRLIACSVMYLGKSGDLSSFGGTVQGRGYVRSVWSKCQVRRCLCSCMVVNCLAASGRVTGMLRVNHYDIPALDRVHAQPRLAILLNTLHPHTCATLMLALLHIGITRYYSSLM